MATATITTKLLVEDLGKDITVGASQGLTAPVEVASGFVVVSTAQTTAIQLFSDTTKIALDKIYGVYIKCETGTLYVILNTSGTDTFNSTTADLVLLAGEPCWLPINAANNAGLKIDAAAVTNTFSYAILGKA